MLSYIIDEKGNKTHVVIPIEEWKRIKEMESLSSINVDSFPEQHISNLIDFLKKIDNLPVEAWKKAYEEHYSYYEKLDVVDLMILYLFRSGELGTIFDDELDHDIPEEDTSVITGGFSARRVDIVKKDGSALDWKTYSLLREKIGISSEQEFLVHFHSHVKFADKYISLFKEKYSRLHRNAERDRLFVYDLNYLYADNIVVKAQEFYPKSSTAKYIAEHLYNSNLSQVYRATKEATERISFFEHERYSLSDIFH